MFMGRENEEDDDFFVEDGDFLPQGSAVQPMTRSAGPPGRSSGPPGSGESKMDRAKRLFPQWDEETIQGYFDQGWSIQQLQDWVRENN